MLFILVSNTSCDRHLECQISCTKVLWPLDHSGTARSPPRPLQVLLQGCTYEANSHELRWPRGRFTCFIWGTSRLWFFFWLSFLAGKLDPSISNSWFCWPCFFWPVKQWNLLCISCESQQFSVTVHDAKLHYSNYPEWHLCSWANRSSLKDFHPETFPPLEAHLYPWGASWLVRSGQHGSLLHLLQSSR